MHQTQWSPERAPPPPQDRYQWVSEAAPEVLAVPGSFTKEEYTNSFDIAADPVISYMQPDELSHQIDMLRVQMTEAARNMQFLEAAALRDRIIQFEKRIESMEAVKNEI